MGFNRRKMEAQPAAAAEKEAAAKHATEAQILEDAGRLVAAWNERQARMPMLFSPTIGCALKAKHWFLWVRCPAYRTMRSVDLRKVDRHPFAALTSLIPALSCRSCRPTRRSPNLSASPTRALLTSCMRNTPGGCWESTDRAAAEIDLAAQPAGTDPAFLIDRRYDFRI
jgi:hypothetical protein